MPRCGQRPLRLTQPGTALAKKLHAHACELKADPGWPFRRLHITLGKKPLQIAFLIARKFGQVVISDVAKAARFGSPSDLRHSVASGSIPGTIAFIAAGGNSPPRVHVAIITARTSSG